MQVSTVSTSPVTITTRNAPKKIATRIDTEAFTLQKDLSLSENSTIFGLPRTENYQNQLRIQGEQEQSMVISKGGNIVASVALEGSAMFQDPVVANIWNEVEGDTDAFASALKKTGYDVTTYKQGTGPTYADIHQQIHGESYETLIARQTIEYTRELALLAGKPSCLNTIA